MERQFRGYPAKNPTSGTSGSSKQNSVYTIERTEPSETPRMFTATISSYELDWDDLKAWLEEKIPGGELDKAEHKKDMYVVKLPRKLEQTDIDAIDLLRHDNPKP